MISRNAGGIAMGASKMLNRVSTFLVGLRPCFTMLDMEESWIMIYEQTPSVIIQRMKSVASQVVILICEPVGEPRPKVLTLIYEVALLIVKQGRSPIWEPVTLIVKHGRSPICKRQYKKNL